MTPTRVPTPQEKSLKHVLVISLLDGWSVIGIAGLSFLLTLIFGELLGMAISLLVLAAGVMELRGRRLLKKREPEAGMKLLVRSQLFLLTVILAYCASRLGSYDEETMLANLTPDMEAVLQESGIGKADIVPLVRMAFFGLYGAVAVTCVIYQGGMALYYRSRIKPVTEALGAPPEMTSDYMV